MSTYQKVVKRYGPGGLEGTDTIDYELTGEAEQAHLSPDRIKNAYAALRQWSADAQDAYDTWPTKTNAQKDAVNREVTRRFGILVDRLADLLLLEGRT